MKGDSLALSEAVIITEAAVNNIWHSCQKKKKKRNTHFFEYTLGPAYNEHFNSQKSARSNRVLVVTELFNIVVNDRILAQQKIICS